jgi:DNA-directed RNA polymerase specialized sigma24 family protein
MVQEDLDRRLQNWAWWTAWGTIGPEVPTRCSSIEGNYESEDVFEGPDPRYEPDLLDGELLEKAIRVLPDISRRVLKAIYVQYPYHRRHNVAQRLKFSVDRLERELHVAKRRLSEQLQRDTARDRGMVESPPGVRDCLTSQ